MLLLARLLLKADELLMAEDSDERIRGTEELASVDELDATDELVGVDELVDATELMGAAELMRAAELIVNDELIDVTSLAPEELVGALALSVTDELIGTDEVGGVSVVLSLPPPQAYKLNSRQLSKKRANIELGLGIVQSWYGIKRWKSAGTINWQLVIIVVTTNRYSTAFSYQRC